MSSTNDVGVDVGKRRLAIGWPAACKSYNIDLKKIGVRNVELLNLSEWIAQTLPFDVHLWIEMPYLSNGPGANQTTTIGMAETVGVVKAAAPWAEVTLVGQSTWKAQVCGNGRFGKDEVAAWLLMYYPALWDLTDGNEDQIDAMCIGLYGKMRSEGLIQPPVKKPRKKRKRANQDSEAS